MKKSKKYSKKIKKKKAKENQQFKEKTSQPLNRSFKEWDFMQLCNCTLCVYIFMHCYSFFIYYISIFCYVSSK